MKREIVCLHLEFGIKGKTIEQTETEMIEVRLNKKQREEISNQLNKRLRKYE